MTTFVRMWPGFIECVDRPGTALPIEESSDDSISAYIAELRLDAAEKTAEADGLQAICRIANVAPMKSDLFADRVYAETFARKPFGAKPTEASTAVGGVDEQLIGRKRHTRLGG
jgi:hypothetical protein